MEKKAKQYKDYLLDEVINGRLTLQEVRSIMYWNRLRRKSCIPDVHLPPPTFKVVYTDENDNR